MKQSKLTKLYEQTTFEIVLFKKQIEKIHHKGKISMAETLHYIMEKGIACGRTDLVKKEDFKVNKNKIRYKK